MLAQIYSVLSPILHSKSFDLLLVITDIQICKFKLRGNGHKSTIKCSDVQQAIKNLLQTFHSGFVGCDGGTFNRHIVLQSGQGRVNGDLVISLVTIRQTQVIILQLNINIVQDELNDATKTQISIHNLLQHQHCLAV